MRRNQVLAIVAGVLVAGMFPACGKSDAETPKYVRRPRVAQQPSNAPAQESTKAPPLASLDPATGDPVEVGKILFSAKKCAVCHNVVGFAAKLGPNLRGVGKRLSDEQLHTWIKAPKKLKPGTIMPAWDGTDGELDAIIAYLKTL